MKHFTTQTILALWRLLDRIRRPNRVSRKRARLISRLDNEDFVRAASSAALSRSGRRPQFAYESSSELYAINDQQKHYFAHRERVNSYLGGLDERGKKLADEYLLAQVEFSPGDNIVDTGANVGDFALAIQSIGAQANIVAFEPSPREFSALERNLASNPAILEFKAVNSAVWSDDDAKMDFYIKSDTADSSVIPIADYDQIISVPTARLDSVLPRKNYKLLKLEAEGAEPEILLGATDVLSCFQFIAADVGFERGLRHESTLPEVTRILTGNGFQVKAVGRDRLVLLFERVAK